MYASTKKKKTLHIKICQPHLLYLNQKAHTITYMMNIIKYKTRIKKNCSYPSKIVMLICIILKHKKSNNFIEFQIELFRDLLQTMYGYFQFMYKCSLPFSSKASIWFIYIVFDKSPFKKTIIHIGVSILICSILLIPNNLQENMFVNPIEETIEINLG